jgi:flagellar protein FliL
MAKDKTKEGGAGEKTPSLLSVVLPVVLISLIAGGGGFAFGSLMGLTKPEAPQAKSEHDAAPEGEAATTETKPEEGAIVRRLTPIVTNLLAPKEAWIRLEAAIVMKPEATSEQDLIAVESSDKIMGFLRSVSLAQIDGPSGLLRLRDDLNDLLAGDAHSHVSSVLITSMVVE